MIFPVLPKKHEKVLNVIFDKIITGSYVNLLNEY